MIIADKKIRHGKNNDNFPPAVPSLRRAYVKNPREGFAPSRGLFFAYFFEKFLKNLLTYRKTRYII